MAVTSTSLTSQLFGPTSLSYCPKFSGLRPSCLKLAQSLFQHLPSHLSLSSCRNASRAVVAMAGTGKVKKSGGKKKKKAILVRLVSSAGTGFFYVTKKPSRIVEKLKFRKFDPRKNRHVLFTETKMK